MSRAALDRATALLGSRVLETHAHAGDETLIVDGPSVRGLFEKLRNDPALELDFLVDLTVVDYLGYPKAARDENLPRFEVVYHLRSMRHGHRLRVKARTVMPEDGSSPV